jgi:hypothetical protein
MAIQISKPTTSNRCLTHGRMLENGKRNARTGSCSNFSNCILDPTNNCRLRWTMTWKHKLFACHFVKLLGKSDDSVVLECPRAVAAKGIHYIVLILFEPIFLAVNGLNRDGMGSQRCVYRFQPTYRGKESEGNVINLRRSCCISLYCSWTYYDFHHTEQQKPVSKRLVGLLTATRNPLNAHGEAHCCFLSKGQGPVLWEGSLKQSTLHRPIDLIFSPILQTINANLNSLQYLS